MPIPLNWELDQGMVLLRGDGVQHGDKEEGEQEFCSQWGMGNLAIEVILNGFWLRNHLLLVCCCWSVGVVGGARGARGAEMEGFNENQGLPAARGLSVSFLGPT